jgi:glycosyltransferase involved in cell wall biosynthesis
MNPASQKALIVAPFWGISGHVGNYRVDRFVRWLGESGVRVVIVRAGGSDRECERSWGVEVTVRDPIGLYRDPAPGSKSAPPPRKPNSFRRSTANFIFNPDPTIVWASRAVKNPLVMKHGEGARWVISSGPPESGHVCAARLAKRIGAGLVVDMRDGWLDEPLKSLLERSRIRRWREGRLESAILRQAERIFVTSDVWKELLEKRLPFTRDKTVILYNGYPNLELSPAPAVKSSDERMTLLHAGRFMHSSLERNPKYLLEPLLKGLGQVERKGKVVLLGQLSRDDMAEVRSWRVRYAEYGWSIEITEPVPREAMMRKLMEADGLLLLSTSNAAVPSKLFEYLAVGKPILAFTPRGSAVWRIGESIQHVSLVDYREDEDAGGAQKTFLDSCLNGVISVSLPDLFHESTLSEIFIANLIKM